MVQGTAENSQERHGDAVHAETPLLNSSTADTPLLPPIHHSKPDNCFINLLESAWNSCTCCCLIGCFFLSSAFTGFKVLSDKVSLFQITIVRSILGLSILVPLAYQQTGMVVGPADHNMKWILLRACCAALAFLFGSLAVTLLDISEAALLNNTHPAVLAFVLSILGLEVIDRLAWTGIIGAVVSQALIARPPFLFGGDEESWDFDRYLGVGFCFLTCLSQVAGFLLISKIDKSVPSIIIANHAAFQLLFIAIPFLALGVPKPIHLSLSLADAGLYIVSSLSVLNQVCIVRSFQIGPSIQASIVTLACPLLVVFDGAVILSEEITWLDAIGGALLVSSIALVIWSRDRAHRRAALTAPESSYAESDGPTLEAHALSDASSTL